MIPVGGVPQIAFLAMKVGMKPGSIGVGKVLGDIVCSMPIPSLGEPKNLEFGGKIGGSFSLGIVETVNQFC